MCRGGCYVPTYFSRTLSVFVFIAFAFGFSLLFHRNHSHCHAVTVCARAQAAILRSSGHSVEEMSNCLKRPNDGSGTSGHKEGPSRTNQGAGVFFHKLCEKYDHES